jgi:hypothetical protein
MFGVLKNADEIDRLTNPPVRIVSEGQTLYLTEEEIAGFLAELRTLPAFRERERLLRDRSPVALPPGDSARSELLSQYLNQLKARYQ